MKIFQLVETAASKRSWPPRTSAHQILQCLRNPDGVFYCSRFTYTLQSMRFLLDTIVGIDCYSYQMFAGGRSPLVKTGWGGEFQVKGYISLGGMQIVLRITSVVRI